MTKSIKRDILFIVITILYLVMFLQIGSTMVEAIGFSLSIGMIVSIKNRLDKLCEDILELCEDILENLN